MCASITKLNLSLSFQIITEDAQTINVVNVNLHEITLEEFGLCCIPYEILPGQKLCICGKTMYFLRKKKIRM